MLESVQSPGAYAIIVSDSLEIVLFGTYTIFFTFAVIILTVSKRPLRIDWNIVAATCVLFISCMAHVSIITTDRHTTFTSGWPIPTGAEMSGLLRAGDIMFKTCGFISQLIMIHRCWAVWDYKHSVVAAPLAMALAGMACALFGPLSLATSSFVSPFVAPRILAFDIAFCVLSLLVYITVTGMIIIHLRRVSAPVRNVQSMEALIWSLVGACIEAGGLLVLAQIFVVILLITNNAAIIIAESIATQIYGIAPTMMIIRLGFRLLPRGRRWESTAPQFSTFLSTIYTDEFSDEIELDCIHLDTVGVKTRTA